MSSYPDFRQLLQLRQGIADVIGLIKLAQGAGVPDLWELDDGQ